MEERGSLKCNFLGNALSPFPFYLRQPVDASQVVGFLVAQFCRPPLNPTLDEHCKFQEKMPYLRADTWHSTTLPSIIFPV